MTRDWRNGGALVYNSEIGQNSTETALSGSATFTGEWERVDDPEVMVMCYTDVAGTVYFDFSNDGSTVHSTYPPDGYPLDLGADGNYRAVHSAVKASRYFRVRLINGSSAQSTLSLYIYYGVNLVPLANSLNATVTASQDAIVTKSIISGVGNTTASVTDHGALQVTPPPEGKSAFGETVVVEPTPIVQVDFPYNINSDIVETISSNSASVTHSNRQATLQTGTNSAGFARMQSIRRLKYNPGQGALVRFTAKFTTGVASSTQIIGIGNESDGLFFGYNGTSFGVLHRRNGSPEIRTLTITTGSSHAENITITLDGDADATVAVTNTADTTLTANEIAAHDYSGVGTGWTARAVGSKVEFTSWDAATHTGSYSLSGTSAVGTFAQNVAGAAPTETWIAQSSWNGDDKFDGNGLTGVTLDPTMGNVYQIKYQWLGYGLLSFYVEDPDDGELHLVHAIEYANANTAPSLGDPSLALFAEVLNSGNTNNLTLQTASMAGFIEGIPAFIGVRRGVRNTKTTVTTSLLPIISVRQGAYLNSKATQTFSKVLRMACAVEHTKPITIVLIEDGTLTGANFSRIDGNVSSMEYDTAATAISGGNETLSIPLGKAGNQYVPFTDDYFTYNMTAGRVITFAAIANSGTNGEATVSLKMLESV